MSIHTFAEIREHALAHYQVVHEEKFLLGLEVPAGENGRRQGVFLAELMDSDGRRFLRFETTIAPLSDHDPEKCLRVNLMLRTGYLAIGDLEGMPFIKLCENLPYTALTADLIDHMVDRLALLGDRMEQTLTGGGDWF